MNLLTFILLLLLTEIPNFANSHEKKNHGHKSFGEPCLERHECNYNVHLHCFERHCGCYTRVTHLFPGEYFLSMKWDRERGSCFSILNSICVGTNETDPPPRKIHAKCLPGLECTQQTDLELGMGTCLFPQATNEQGNGSENMESTESYEIGSGLDTVTDDSPTYWININQKPESLIPCSTNSARQMIHTRYLEVGILMMSILLFYYLK